MAAGAGGDDLKLLGMWASPAVLRVRLALSIKGISSYEYQEEDFANKSELLLRSNPVHKMVPVLIHAGKPAVCESTVIIQYLDEAFAGDALLPAGPYDRAVARFWAAFIDDTLLKAMYQASWSKTEEEKAEGKKKVAAALRTLDGALGEVAGGKPFFGGDAPGYVDTVLGGLLAWARSMDVINGVKTIDPETMPLLAAWADRFGALDAVEAVMPDVNRLVEFSLSLTT